MDGLSDFITTTNALLFIIIYHVDANKHHYLHHQLIFFIIDQHIAAANTAALNGLCRRQRPHPLAAAAPYRRLLHRRTDAAGCCRWRCAALRPRLSLTAHSHQRHLDHR